MSGVHAILIVIIRLWAAGVLVSSLSQSMLVLSLFFDGTTDAFGRSAYISFFVWLAAGVCAWVLAPRIVRSVYKGKDDGKYVFTVNADALVAIGSFLIGCYLLAQYLPPLAVQTGALFAQLAEHDQSSDARPFYIPYHTLFNSVLLVAAGGWMAFRAGDLARIFSWLRSAGLSPPDARQPDKDDGPRS